MTQEDHIESLLDRWEALLREGQDVTAEELAADAPDVVEELRQRIAALRATQFLESHEFDADDRTHLTSLVTGDGRLELPDSSLSSDELVKQLSETELMSTREVNLWLDAHPEPEIRADAKMMAARLIEEGKITPYQATILLQGQTEKLLVDKYLILDSLDAGGMGVVFKAIHRPMNRVVALKMLSPHLLNSPDKVQRFRREAQVAASLNHSNIVTAFDADESKGVHFLVMEHVHGKDLKKVVDSNGPLTVDQAIDCLLQAARGLAHAHKKGVIHRDIKPSNLMLSTDGVVKVLDLGLARMDEGLQLVEQELSIHETTTAIDEMPADTREHLTHAGTLMGTVAFMAPEQALDTHSVDHRADIYSLGCTLYYLLVGEAPYRGENPMQTVVGHREAPIPSLRKFRPDVPEELDAICRRMLAKQPDDRPQLMAEVISGLGALENVVASLRTSDRDKGRRGQGGSVADSGDAATVLEESAVDSTTRSMPTAGLSAGSAVRKRSLYVTAAALLVGLTVTAVIWNPFGTSDESIDPSVARAPEHPTDSGFGAQSQSIADFALEFNDPNDYVHIPSLHYDGGPITVEAFVTISSADNAWYIFETRGERYARLTADKERIGFQVKDGGSQFQKVNMLREVVPAGRDFHIAGVFDDVQATVFIDGKKIGSVRLAEGEKHTGRFSQFGRNGASFVGMIREARISNIARYTDSFNTIPQHFETDEHTLALYHFDEGEGDVLVDSSGNGHHGQIDGATWLRVDAAASESDPEIPFNWADYWQEDAPSPAVAPFNADEAERYQRQWAEYLDMPVERDIELPGGETLELVLIPPGEFLMGSSNEEQVLCLNETWPQEYGYESKMIASEGPRHRVRISRPFYLGKYEVTQAQWEAVMGNNPSGFPGHPSHPIEQVDLNDAQAMLSALNDGSPLTDLTFGVPTEAQWEYACRAGTTTLWQCEDVDQVEQFGWIRGNADRKTHPVGQLRPNAWGLHDMHGNVYEFCSDWVGLDYYSKSTGGDPSGPATPRASWPDGHILRGGGWVTPVWQCRAARRHGSGYDDGGIDFYGFRLAATIDLSDFVTSELESSVNDIDDATGSQDLAEGEPPSE